MSFFKQKVFSLIFCDLSSHICLYRIYSHHFIKRSAALFNWNTFSFGARLTLMLQFICTFGASLNDASMQIYMYLWLSEAAARVSVTPIAPINMQLFCICHKCARRSTQIWLWLFIYSATSCHFGHVYDTCDFWATATTMANWL